MSVEALRGVRARVDAAAAAAGRAPESVRLVAVSKTKPLEALVRLYDEGHRDFGENYVQEMVEKAAAAPADVRFHFIGHLQSNKVRLLLGVPQLVAVETVDKAKLATRLGSVWEALGREGRLDVSVQVNTSGEASKSGCEPAECVELARHVAERCPRLRLVGLMTIGRFDEDPHDDCFRCLVRCRDEVAEALERPPESLGLSMGMSGDFELAVRLGATSVRVGSTIFGKREK